MSQAIITKIEQTDSKRMNFLPKVFGPKLMLIGEATIFGWMASLSEDYKGGLWNFYTLSNGGFYMAPAMNKPLRICVGSNGYEGVLTPDGAGIVATIFALNQLLWTEDGKERDTLVDQFYQLRDYACQHAEGSQILAAID